jgi:2-keto-4-pentenoate hydratase/2-oxohepta-3-ene-1,7-dioic acid hydratase in catechol pathway
MRIGPPGQERPVVRVDNHHFVDVSDLIADFDERFFAGGGTALLTGPVAERIAAGETQRLGHERIGSPIARPHQILCIGLNYSDHATESGQPIPTEPIVFTKSPNSMVGPRDGVRIPRGADTLDWEVELGVVIGRRTSYLNAVADAADAIAGFVLVNDISERTFQRHRGGQWCKGKSAETFNPTGPWLATPDEIQDLDDLDIWLDVNGIRRQTGSTKTMIFSVWEIVHHLSQFMVLEPGDLIDTGTPPGVGQAQDPPTYLQAGDQLEFGIQHLGIQLHQVLAPSEAAA